MKKANEMEPEASEEARQIMGHMPHWIIRRGILLMFLILAVLFVFSFFFSYPDMIAAKIEIISENPSVSLSASKSGKIAQIFAADNQKVLKDAPLLILESHSNPEHIQELKRAMANVQNNLNQNLPPSLDLPENLQVGEIYEAYANYLKAYRNYKLFHDLKYHQTKLSALQEQIKRQELLYEKHREQNEQNELRLVELKIAVLRLNEATLDLQLRNEQQNYELRNAHQKLKNQITLWEDEHILRAPIDGIVCFNKFRHVNQDVQAGDIVVTIIPEISAKISGQIELPLKGVGKVRPNQKVNIKFERYPYMEYGTVRGIIGNIALMPSAEKTYIAEVELPNGLNTSYKRMLQFTRGMEGIAEIITDDQTVASRFIQPVRSILQQLFLPQKNKPVAE